MKIRFIWFYKHLINNNKLYKKQFGCKENNSIEHTIVQVIDQINNSFEIYPFTLGVFIDISQDFDTVDHIIFIKKYRVENYRVK